jgi:hypothetical protein
LRLQLSLALATVAAAVAPGSAAADSPWQITMDTLVYGDTDNVAVVSPQVAVHRELDESGGEVSTRVVVDYISAASVDVVSQATPRFSEVRTEVNLAVSKHLLQTLSSLSYRYSHEPDYISHGVRAGFERRLGGADTTLAGGYGVTRDNVGMSGTPSDVFSEQMTSHAADIGITQVLGRRTLARVVYSLTLQTGYMEKPYRLVPLFDAAGLAAAASDGVALDIDSFDAYRLSSKPAEQVPDDRVRHALAVRGMRYLAWLDASVRLDYQLYLDSWGVVAHTLEPALHVQLRPSWRLASFARLYRQSAASFWERTYVVSAEGMVPRWRTIDRGLSAFDTATGGARVEWEHGPLSAYIEGSAMYTRFDDYLFLDHRLALIGQAGLRWVP